MPTETPRKSTRKPRVRGAALEAQRLQNTLGDYWQPVGAWVVYLSVALEKHNHGDYACAMVLYKSALGMLYEKFGAKHPSVVDTLQKMMLCLALHNGKQADRASGR